MSYGICTFKKGTEDYNKLSMLAALLTANSKNHYRYYVEDTYFDLGQDWMWTTVICEGGYGGSYQALNPAEQEFLLLKCNTYSDIVELMNHIFDDKFCPDAKA